MHLFIQQIIATVGLAFVPFNNVVAAQPARSLSDASPGLRSKQGGQSLLRKGVPSSSADSNSEEQGIDSRTSSNKERFRYLSGSEEKDECFDMYSEMTFNNLVQDFPGNPDSGAYGYASFKLCTNGTMTSTTNVYGGKTTLIACHVHIASNKDGYNGSGPPVLNFCGKKGSGMINDGQNYTKPCMPYNENDTSITKDVEGVKVTSDKMYDLIHYIAQYPEQHYFNCHSIASWTHWQAVDNGEPVGMCRGVMAMS